MPIYNYTAKTVEGTVEKNTMEAIDQEHLQQKLRAQGFFLVSCKEENKSASAVKIKAMELSDFCRQIGTMMGSGVSLLRAMDIISQRDIKPRLKKVYQNLSVSLQQGVSLWESMEKEKGAFPELLVNMFAAGEASGKLDQTAMKMAIHYEKEYRLHAKIRSAAAYPLILLVITVLVMIVIFTFVLPNFFDMFKGTVLPMPTRIVMGISSVITGYWYIILIVLALVVGANSYLLSIPKIRAKFDRLKLRLPLFGKLLRTIYTARFARTLSSLYSSGLSMLDALSVSRGTIGNLYISNQFEDIIQQIRQGTALSVAMARVDGFDIKLASTIMIGEETGRLDDMLESVADAFDYEADMATQRLTTILEPLLIVLMAIIVGFVMISVMLPIYDMYNSIGT
ncbi:MAG: type II secretion system F family protein [Clostridiales bacterium]